VVLLIHIPTYEEKGAYMNELVDLVVKKTGIPAATAQTVVNTVLDFLKKKLPAPVASQIDGLMSNSDNVKKAEGMLGNVSSMFGKKK
jgi:hypothetical protein